MKKLRLYSLLLLFIITACSDKPTDPTVESSHDFGVKLQELNKNISKLESPLPESSLEDLAPLNKIADSRYIGMGEATHGTQEFFQLKHKVFRYLVEEHGFRVFAIEADMGESFYIDQYVATGKGNLGKIMKSKMHFWTWKTREVKALIEWIHDYNQGKPESERLYYIGIDCQFMTYQPSLIENYFEKFNPEFVDEANDVLTVIRELGNKDPSTLFDSYRDMSLSQKNVIADTLGYLMNKMSNFKNELVLASSNYQYKFTRHLIRNLQQVNEVAFASVNDKNGTNLRDKFMAENALWISQLLGDTVKVAIWAHNGHIAAGEIYEGLIRMGEFLKNILTNNYKTIGFSFSTGKFMARGYNSTTDEITGLEIHSINSPVSGSVNDLFHQAQYQNFILNIDALPSNSSLKKWLSSEQAFLTIGAVFNGNPADYYADIKLSENFNVMIHVDETDYSRHLLDSF